MMEEKEQTGEALKRKRNAIPDDVDQKDAKCPAHLAGLPMVPRPPFPSDRPAASSAVAPSLEPTDWGIPEGWVGCPSVGEALEGLIPCKVPLGANFAHKLEKNTTFSPAEVVVLLKKRHQEVGLVIDLTNTRRYYNPKEWSKLNVRHVKIACKGRDATPTEENVNEFFFEVHSFFQRQLQQAEKREGGGGGPPKYVLVHCTHGFNRTGYMIVNYLMRVKAMLCEEAILAFAKARPDGIYKEDYLSELYRLSNEAKFRTLPVPSLPSWKPPEVEKGDGPEDVLEAEEAKAAAAAVEVPEASAALAHPAMTIDDVLGSPIPLEHQLELQKIVSWGLGVLSPQAMSNSWHGKQLNFPGSQPVSLDNQNFWEHISSKYYYVTWKADGTRYMVLITNDGAYVIDRTFTFRRMQLRFPRRKREGEPFVHHHYTLLDGEMVIDKVDAAGKMERRYLIYDMMMLNMEPIVNLPFSRRWQMILDEVIMPRKQDAAESRYDYDAEPCRVRRKDFYPLAHTEKILRNFIPSLPHEADGLIFQGWDECYVPRTSQELLKWKYAHMNSVDFLLEAIDPNRPRLFLRDKSTGLRELLGATVSFPGGQSAKDFHKAIVECSWNSHTQSWEYMRTRVDKDSPNAWHVYEKVMASIRDNITEEVLLDKLAKVNNLPLYKNRKRP